MNAELMFRVSIPLAVATASECQNRFAGNTRVRLDERVPSAWTLSSVRLQ